MIKYISRWIETRLQDALESHPVIVLTGPRQVGKSTLLKHAPVLRGWRYITLDDSEALDQAREDPKGLLWEDKPTIIDEVQRCPDLLLTIKYFVDQTERRRKFILSGSGNISLRKAPRETLAGRAQHLHLTGFGYREMKGAPASGFLSDIFDGSELSFPIEQDPSQSRNIDMTPVVLRGGLPGVVLATSEKIARERLSSYIDTYLQRDIQDLVKIRHPQHFRRLMKALAQATGWESVQEELSKSCGETRTNVSRYMSLMKDTQLLYELKGYAAKGERAYRQSKYFWFDSGAACFLAGIYQAEYLAKQSVKGRFFENFILQQVLSWASLQVIAPEILYWKPKSQDGGVDFVVCSGNRCIAMEVKSSNQVTFADTKPMREFMKSHSEVSKGILIYAGDKVFQIASNIFAVPWTAL